MDLFFGVSVGFIIIGLVVLVSMKKSMERKLAFIIETGEDEKGHSKSIIWWITGTTIWGIVSMYLVVSLFSRIV